MKTILAYLDPNNFYKVDITGEVITKILQARNILSGCEFDGSLLVPIGIWSVTAKQNILGSVIINKVDNTITSNVVVNFLNETLLDCDDLFTIPDIHLTKKFLLMKEDAEKYLSPIEKELIRRWEA